MANRSTVTDNGQPEPYRHGHKTVIFDKGLEDAVQILASTTRRSFSATCLDLIEKGFDGVPGQDNGYTLLQRNDLPPWMIKALAEAAQLTGQNLKSLIIELLNANMLDFLTKVRTRVSNVKQLSRPAAKRKS